MSPKFRGNSSSWLDDQKSRKRVNPKQGKKPAGKGPIPRDEANATVTAIFPKLCGVLFDADGSELLCSYRRADVLDPKSQERSPVAVGDRVKVEKLGSKDGVVQGVAERLNLLSRRAPGEGDQERVHVLAANIDLVVVVASVLDPQFSVGVVDRFLLAARVAQIPAVLFVNKTDLLQPATPHVWECYTRLGVRVIEGCVKTGRGLEDLRQEIHDKTALFCGHSGVGKTSLLNRLLGREIGRVGEVSSVLRTGTHTTTSAILIQGPENSQWIDTPGVREFSLSQVSQEDLDEFFQDETHASRLASLHSIEQELAERSSSRGRKFPSR